MAEDRISDLPIELRIHILSFLPTEIAARTSVLSKKWQHLFFLTSKLSFTYVQDTGKREFKTFVNNVILRRRSSPLEKLSLILERGVDGDSVLQWISYALDNGVSDLEINLYNLKHWERPPQTVFVNKQLVKLSIGLDICCILPEDYNFDLPKLKTLCLDDVVFLDGGYGFMKLLSGCPVLEDLVMKDMREWCEWTTCVVSSKTLKSFIFYWDIYSVEDREERPKSVSFDTPSLLSLEYDDNVAGHYPKLKFDSLVEATICLRRKVGEEEEYEKEEEENDATAFLKGIWKVKTLHLRPGTLEVLRFCCQQIPEFTNLSHLEVVRDPKIGWEAMSDLRANCPNLKKLVQHEEEVRV